MPTNHILEVRPTNIGPGLGGEWNGKYGQRKKTLGFSPLPLNGKPEVSDVNGVTPGHHDLHVARIYQPLSDLRPINHRLCPQPHILVSPSSSL